MVGQRSGDNGTIASDGVGQLTTVLVAGYYLLPDFVVSHMLDV